MTETYWPALAEMEPIGVGGKLEAVAVYHFCSTECREYYRMNLDARPSATGTYDEIADPSSVAGEVCEACGREL